MGAVLVNLEDKTELSFLMGLMKKLGMTAKPLSKTELEDWKFAQKIEKGMKSSSVSKKEILKALGK